MVKLYPSFHFKIVFLAYIKKLTHLIVGAWSFLLVHTRFPPSEGPKGFVNFLIFFLRNWTMKA